RFVLIVTYTGSSYSLQTSWMAYRSLEYLKSCRTAKFLGFFKAVERKIKQGVTLNAVSAFAFGGVDFSARGATREHNQPDCQSYHCTVPKCNGPRISPGLLTAQDKGTLPCSPLPFRLFSARCGEDLRCHISEP